MTIRIPNRTAQTGVYKTGSPDYVDVSSGTAVASMVTFSAKATDDSWADSDTVGVAITKDASNYKVWLSSWDETNEYLELVTEEESVGTISDTDAVTVTAVLTQGTIEDTLNLAAHSREVLTADRTYYVRTDGSDSNDGLTNSSGGAFLTIQKGLNVAATLDSNNYNVIIQVADGTYTGAITGVSFVGGGALTIQGNSGTPSNVHINVTGTAIYVSDPRHFITIKDVKISSTVFGIGAYPAGRADFSNVNFGSCTSGHIFCAYRGFVQCNGSYAISGGGGNHLKAAAGGAIRTNGITVTLTGTPAFTAFAAAEAGNTYSQSTTYTGAATGSRYTASLNGVISTAGGGASYFPGDSAGTTATGGQYV